MPSFYAELHLAGTSYRVVRCQYACHQATDARGRVNAKVRHDLLHLTLDVPDDDVLLDWAAAPFKPLAGDVVFYNMTQLVPHETIAFATGQCVAYQEVFASGATGNGAYVCHISVTAPSFELRSGGPAAAVVAGQQAQRIIGAAQQVGAAVQQVAQVAAIAREVANEAPAAPGGYSLQDPATHFVRPAAASDWALSQRLDQIFPISLNNPIGFAEAVRADLQAIYNTPTGRKLIDSLQESGKKISINFNESNGAAFPNFADDPHGEREPNWEPAFFEEAGTGTGAGAGVAMSIGYNPFRESVGEAVEDWHKRPPGIGLAHELIHAEQAAHGRMIRGKVANPVKSTDAKPLTIHAYELETIGVPPYDEYAVSENKIRDEWDPTQPRRTHY